MAVLFGTNLASMTTLRFLGRAEQGLRQVFERLSTGRRINRASDDAAGLSLSAGLNVDSRVYTQALRNINDGISAASVAEGALGQLSTISIRLKELASQSANGTISLTQRTALNAEANQLVDEFNRILQSTSFNGRNLLSGEESAGVNIQMGYGALSNVNIQFSSSLERTVGTGQFNTATNFTGVTGPGTNFLMDQNGDGILDLAARSSGGAVSVRLGNGDGTFGTAFSTPGGTGGPSTVGDLDNDGRDDVVMIDTVSGILVAYTSTAAGSYNAAISSPASFYAGAQSLITGDFNHDGTTDVIVGSNDAGTRLMMYTGNGDGTFNTGATFFTGGAGGFNSLAVGDFDGDGWDDIAAVYGAGTSLDILRNNHFGSGISTGTKVIGASASVAFGDLNGDGRLDVITGGTGGISTFINAGSSVFNAGQTIAGAAPGATVGDVNNDGFVDIISARAAYLNSGTGTFAAGITFSTNGSDVVAGDYNGDGVLDVFTVNGTNNFILQTAITEQVTSISRVDITTQQGALQALDEVTTILSRVTKQLGQIGAAQSRLESNLSRLTAARENYESAESRIVDADVATEVAYMTRLRIIEQVSSGILAQANQSPEIGLFLLQNSTRNDTS